MSLLLHHSQVLQHFTSSLLTFLSPISWFQTVKNIYDQWELLLYNVQVLGNFQILFKMLILQLKLTFQGGYFERDILYSNVASKDILKANYKTLVWKKYLYKFLYHRFRGTLSCLNSYVKDVVRLRIGRPQLEWFLPSMCDALGSSPGCKPKSTILFLLLTVASFKWLHNYSKSVTSKARLF